jgi:hypothetical protein
VLALIAASMLATMRIQPENKVEACKKFRREKGEKLEISVALPLIRFYMQQWVPRIGWLRRRNQSTVKLMQYYWATIAECVPPPVIIEALAAGGFKNVRRSVSNGVLSEYLAER